LIFEFVGFLGMNRSDIHLFLKAEVAIGVYVELSTHKNRYHLKKSSDEVPVWDGVGRVM
jgi:hypothetical protein